MRTWPLNVLPMRRPAQGLSMRRLSVKQLRRLLPTTLPLLMQMQVLQNWIQPTPLRPRVTRLTMWKKGCLAG